MFTVAIAMKCLTTLLNYIISSNDRFNKSFVKEQIIAYLWCTLSIGLLPEHQFIGMHLNTCFLFACKPGILVEG